MKRNAHRHTKMRALSKRMNIPQYAAVGLMESLWHWAADQVPDGGIGKYGDEDIADSITWDQPDRSHELIEALADCGFLDEMSGCRLYIHDWHEHCEISVHKRLARSGLLFANGHQPSLSGLDSQERHGPTRTRGDSNPPPPPHRQPPLAAVRPAGAQQQPTVADVRTPCALPKPKPKPKPEPCSPYPLKTGDEEVRSPESGVQSQESVSGSGPGEEEAEGPNAKIWREVYRILKESITLSLLTYAQVVKACRDFPNVDLLAEAKKMAKKSAMAVNSFDEPGMWVYSWLQKCGPKEARPERWNMKKAFGIRPFDPVRDLENGP